MRAVPGATKTSCGQAQSRLEVGGYLHQEVSADKGWAREGCVGIATFDLEVANRGRIQVLIVVIP